MCPKTIRPETIRFTIIRSQANVPLGDKMPFKRAKISHIVFVHFVSIAYFHGLHCLGVSGWIVSG